VLEWAKREDMGVVLEIKEVERPDLAVDRAAALLEATGQLEQAGGPELGIGLRGQAVQLSAKRRIDAGLEPGSDLNRALAQWRD
jgi:hypothetical protein